MSELDELPSWAGRSTDGDPSTQQGALERQAAAPTSVAPIEPRGRRPWKIAMLALFGIAALLGMGVLGYLLAENNNNSTEAAADDADTNAGQLGSEQLSDNATDGDDTTGSADDQVDAEAGEDGANETDSAITVDIEGEGDETSGTDDADGSADSTDTDSTDADGGSTDTDADAENTDADAAGTDSDADSGIENDSGRRAVVRGGKVYLSGAVPSEEIGQLIEQRAAAVIGPDNVINEYTIDPTAEIRPGESSPLYVEDVVLFEFNSIEVARPFFPILDLGTALLRQNPQASVTVITRTDAVGSEEINLDVSRRRAQAIIDYWVKSGVNPDQIIADPRGEEGASEVDDEQTQAQSRRAEFIITGLLD